MTEEETGGNDRRGIAGIGMTKSGENDTLSGHDLFASGHIGLLSSTAPERLCRLPGDVSRDVGRVDDSYMTVKRRKMVMMCVGV